MNQKKSLANMPHESDFLIDKGLCEVEKSLQLSSVLLNVPIICLVFSLLFICKSYLLFIPIFII
jgi:hypothetical protein